MGFSSVRGGFAGCGRGLNLSGGGTVYILGEG
jgi:hypothetical protein